ncbi:hypothetical protein TNCV_2002021 [Trichonephila clavipes]|nr:hypothetical protein TNCV_2002021 [Trichonephila clavipes]
MRLLRNPNFVGILDKERVGKGNLCGDRQRKDERNSVLCYLAEGYDTLQDLEERIQPPDLSSEKCNAGCSKNLRCKHEIFVSFTQWLPKLSHQMQGPYEDIESKQVTSVLLDDSRLGYVQYDAAGRTKTRLKRRHSTTLVFSFVFANNTLTLHFYVEKSREAEKMVLSTQPLLLRNSSHCADTCRPQTRSPSVSRDVICLYNHALPI